MSYEEYTIETTVLGGLFVEAVVTLDSAGTLVDWEITGVAGKRKKGLGWIERRIEDAAEVDELYEAAYDARQETYENAGDDYGDYLRESRY